MKFTMRDHSSFFVGSWTGWENEGEDTGWMNVLLLMEINRTLQAELSLILSLSPSLSPLSLSFLSRFSLSMLSLTLSPSQLLCLLYC
jgi:hypothetical protein